jgi:CRISPR/Cas system-associated exonuclease Cas4 (RecB family)
MPHPTLNVTAGQRRLNPFLHPSWMSDYLSGDSICDLALYLKANYQLPKSDNTFDAETYKYKHNLMVYETAQLLLLKGWKVYKENQNKYYVESDSNATFSCQPDLIATKNKRTIVLECKTGKKYAKHIAQVQLYMATLPKAELHGIDTVPTGYLVYNDGIQKVSKSSLSVSVINMVNDLIDKATGEQLPEAKPSCSECKYCKVATICGQKEPELVTGKW